MQKENVTGVTESASGLTLQVKGEEDSPLHVLYTRCGSGSFVEAARAPAHPVGEIRTFTQRSYSMMPCASCRVQSDVLLSFTVAEIEFFVKVWAVTRA